MQIKHSLVEPRLSNFLNKNRLKIVDFLAKGFSSYVFIVKRRNEKSQRFVLKILRNDSPRQNLAREAKLLKLLNRYSIGPKLINYDKHNKALLMEFIRGETLAEFIESKPKRGDLIKVLSELLRQAAMLDYLGISHGQLGGKLKNIIVRPNRKVVIIDFEKASKERKAKNFRQVLGELLVNKHSHYAKIVRRLLFN